MAHQISSHSEVHVRILECLEEMNENHILNFYLLRSSVGR